MVASVWHTDILMHVTAHRGLYEHQSLHWKLTLGEKSLAALGTRTHVSTPWIFSWMLYQQSYSYPSYGRQHEESVFIVTLINWRGDDVQHEDASVFC